MRPAYDSATRQMYFWPARLDTRPSDEVIHLDRDRAVRVELEKALMGARIVLLYCHGTQSSVLGYGDEEMLDVASVQSGILQERVVMAFSCHSAIGLSAVAMRADASAYLGFTSRFWVVEDLFDAEQADAAHTALEWLRAGRSLREAERAGLIAYDNLLDGLRDGAVAAGRDAGVSTVLMLINRGGFSLRGDPGFRL